MSTATPLTRRAPARPVKGSSAFDVPLSGQRERGGLPIGPGQWAIPERVPVTVHRGGAEHDVGVGRVFIDGKGNPGVRGMWSSSPLGEYVKALVVRGDISYADVEIEASIDNAGARIYQVLSVALTMPADPPSVMPHTTHNDAQLNADTAAELLALAARIYASQGHEAGALADRVIACAVALGGTPTASDCEN